MHAVERGDAHICFRELVQEVGAVKGNDDRRPLHVSRGVEDARRLLAELIRNS